MRFAKEADYYRAMQILSEAGCPLDPAANPPSRPQSRPLSSASTLINADDQGTKRPNTAHAPIQKAGNTISIDQVYRNQIPGPSDYKETYRQMRATEERNMGSICQPTSLAKQPLQAEESTLSAPSSFAQEPRREDIQNDSWNIEERRRLGPVTYQDVNTYYGLASTSPLKKTDIGDLIYTPRPSTAPEMQSQGTIASMLPPPRDLPFKKPASRMSSKGIKDQTFVSVSTPLEFDAKIARMDDRLNKPAAVQASQDVISPPIPVSKRPRTSSGEDSTKRPRKASATPRRRPARRDLTPVPTVDEILARDKLMDLPSSAGEAASSLDLSKPCTNIGIPFQEKQKLAANIDASNGSVKPPNDKCDQQATITPVNHNSRSLSETEVRWTGIPSSGECIDPIQLQTPSNNTPPLTSFPPKLLASDLSKYASEDSTATQSERLAVIESFICEQLQDEGFHRLVLDMDTWWPRLMIGKSIIGAGG